MRAVKGFMRFLLVLLVLGLVAVELYIHGVFDFVEDLDKLSSYEELCNYTVSALKNGDEEFKIYLENVTEEEIKAINKDISSFFGHVKAYSIMSENKEGKLKLDIELDRSVNYKVYKALVDNKSTDGFTKKEQALYDKAKEIVNDINANYSDDYDKEEAVHDYIIKNCVYQKNGKGDPEDDIYTAYGALVNQTAVCNGYAEAMYLLLNACGIENEIVIGEADNDNHAWNVVKLEDKWYQVDITWDDPVPDIKDTAQHTFFNITDEAMAKTHSWINANYPVCDSADKNYFQMHKLVCKDYEDVVNKTNKAINKRKPSISLLVPNYNKEEYNLTFVMDNHPEIVKASYSAEDSGIGTVLAINFNYTEK
ncbi:MAG: hypothetical protein K5656_00185 [Lachnospiraceae bacterium]|nr:hypothetical protein [Lachnospiraceae bacterium]